MRQYLRQLPWYEHRGCKRVQLVEYPKLPTFASYVNYLNTHLRDQWVVLANQVRGPSADWMWPGDSTAPA